MTQPYVLITGGAGFLGSNLADRLLHDGRRVLLYDSLVRANVQQNVRWLTRRHGDRVRLVIGDVLDPLALRRAISGADQVFHLAAQEGATRSLSKPLTDFGVNAAGTLLVLEALRARSSPPPLVFASTSQVYGVLSDVALRARGTRYEPEDPDLCRHGIGESRPLAFSGPYGCSKGAGDQYVLDYARTFDLPACVLRMGSVFGPRQFGTEDQGWLTHFLARSRDGERLVFHGDGLQVRDALFVDDLVEALLAARDGIDRLRGQAFNLGGGPERTTSLWELVDRIERLHGRRPEVDLRPWRPSDQRWYASDTRAFSAATGWQPMFSLDEGLLRLDDWLYSSRLVPQTEARSQNRAQVEAS